MELHINDLSFQRTFVVEDKEKMIVDFLNICDTAKQYYLEKIVVPADYLNKDIGREFSFSSSFLQIPDKEFNEHLTTHSRIRSLFANRFKIIQSIDEGEILYWIEWRELESEFLKAANSHNCPVLSFRTHLDFENSTINVQKVILVDNDEQIKSDEIIGNISEPTHFSIHNEILSRWKLKQAELNSKWTPLTRPFRFHEQMRDYLTTIKYDEQMQNIDDHQRVSLARTIGKVIAEMNGWQHHMELSRKNDRVVFKALNNTVYLAIDTETVSFELHDRRGNHRGEYNFYGEILEDPKGHKLNVS